MDSFWFLDFVSENSHFQVILWYDGTRLHQAVSFLAAVAGTACIARRCTRSNKIEASQVARFPRAPLPPRQSPYRYLALRAYLRNNKQSLADTWGLALSRVLLSVGCRVGGL
ncbi:hypothetical protein BKA82DRAFT_35838 [Pisolithus tinctorius]|uniref:Uncharacterized protein n=1 Tax=Pisolithus tinctorius Marx 270 TaxID=870435 RepID=A0A0C3I9B5_PISTI|nr:hypothetical protein BKA82DRAFT_35838 [Pisolithus tinctorius]KIN93707.1 hypothetical protein M404DRAFT_35838 [Pisolithus tinctorius Marx 270]